MDDRLTLDVSFRVNQSLRLTLKLVRSYPDVFKPFYSLLLAFCLSQDLKEFAKLHFTVSPSIEEVK